MSMLRNNTIVDCSLIELPKIKNRAGNITAIENNINIPFGVSRVFYLYDIPAGIDRGAHAHKECHQLLVAASGSFDVLLCDGKSEMIVNLNQPNKGLHIPPGIWASEVNFSSGSICLVLASDKYDEKDYIRDYQEFLNYKR
ncbi:FdtA/QdtA family cupin domain-containing protein [Flavobacteriaceae bacterium]|nr:FdtA/QdtA family cupin domain-containing protein [Flavobacteriaceae bacterium]